MAFHLPLVYILGKNHFAGKLHELFVIPYNKIYCKCTHDYAERYRVISEQVQSQFFSVCKSIFMEVVAIDHFNKLKLSTIPMEQSHYHLSD